MKKYLCLAALVAVVVCLTPAAHASNQASPSASATIQARRAAVDGNGLAFPGGNSDVGYKVFEDSGSAAAVLVLDEAGNAPTCGLLHAVCVSGTATGALVVDKASTSGVTITSANALLPEVEPVSSALTCQVVDAQFNKGLVVVNADGNGASYLYWRPCRGGKD